MELDLFVGRFHPLVVHLPIGFVLIAILLELVAVYTGKGGSFKMAIRITWLAGIVGSLMSMVSGLMLADGGSYDEEVLNPHKFLGITVFVLCVVAYWLRGQYDELTRKSALIASAVLFAIISATGHMGGVLTHGETYLTQYAPDFIRTVLGVEETKGMDLSNVHPDSVLVYRDLVQPILTTKCVSCHSADKTSGQLNLQRYSHLFEEAESGPAIVAGSVGASELFRRITLDPSSSKFMPPKGDALSYTETSVIKWWIDQGADSLATFDPSLMTEELITLVQRDVGLDYNPRPYYEKVVVDSVGGDVLAELRNAGIRADYLGSSNYLLDVKLDADQWAEKQQSALTKAAATSAFVNLSGAKSLTGRLGGLKEAKHLIRLDVHGTDFSDSDLPNLAGSAHLEVLNVYATAVTDTGLANALEILPALKKIYVWQSGVTDQGIQEMQSKYPDVSIIAGYN
ncbi:MAG: hypothetical protein JXQ90_19445 [Cyclobacteriaceae bacterium]